jgi:signal transduction histidine kinase
VLCGATPRADAQRTGLPTHVLLVYQQQAEAPSMLLFAERLRRAVVDQIPTPVEFYQEALDLDRFPGAQHEQTLDKYFADKYREVPVDVVVPIGIRAFKFTVDRLDDVLAGIPIVCALCIAPQLDSAAPGANVTGRVAPASRFGPTLSMARRLQPDAERIVVIGGSGPSDSNSVGAALTAVTALRDSLPLVLLQGLPLDSLLMRLRHVPRRSIVLFANYRQGGYGQAFEPLDIIGTLSRTSAAPMYAQLASDVGEGVVGGSTMEFDEEGMLTGRLVVRVLRRRPGERIPPVEAIGHTYVADWRQLQRWHLSEQLLPSGTEVRFREPTPWQRYQRVVLPALALIAAESLLIGLLLVERRRRQQAQVRITEQERLADEARRQMAHLGRVSLVGELAATISHDLRQPLAAIRANAEAGALLLARDADSVSEAREIFGSIVADDARAVQVIDSVRHLLQKDRPMLTALDLNDVCRNAIGLLHHDADRRKVRLELSQASTLPVIVGDPVQLQQVVLNLVLNGIEAASASTGERFVAASTESYADHVEVIVHDSGPGLSPTVLRRLFESFFSTKPAGLGLGLVIVRSIVERHGGRVHGENHPFGGAVFRIQLPSATADGATGPSRLPRAAEPAATQ